MSGNRTDTHNTRYTFRSVYVPGYMPPPIRYELISEDPNVVEQWFLQKTNSKGKVNEVLGLTAVDCEYVEKGTTTKWSTPLIDCAREKVEGRGQVSFKHVVKARYEIGLSFFGNLHIGTAFRVTDVTAVKCELPILMQQTVQAEIDDYIPFCQDYGTNEVVPGYESGQLENQYLQYYKEEIIERMLDDAGFIFSDDGESFFAMCSKCKGTPCVWEENKHEMMLLSELRDERESAPNQLRHVMYRQMALVINKGPSGRGNRLKLPECVTAGIREMFPDPNGKYTGHRNIESDLASY